MNSSPKNSASNIQPIDKLVDLLLSSDSLADEPISVESDDNRHNLTASVSVDKVESDKSDRELPDKTDLNGLEMDFLEDNANHPEISVDLEDTASDMTLQAAIEYEALLPPTTESQSGSNLEPDSANSIVESSADSSGENNLVESYAMALTIDPESASSEELVNSVNTLIPLIVELLRYKIDDSQETIFQAVTSIVERSIEQRAAEEPEKMAAAISSILPAAISTKIKLNPQTIAKAIAPEIALAIEEQILLDEKAMAQVLGPEMGKAIKTQIELEKDAMVDALYPVIGDTISKYMVEVVKEINRKVENTLSLEGFKRKIKARIKGLSEAELILQESIGCYTQAAFLIDKDSGIVIEKVQKTGEQELDSDMIAGMLTAIRSFANDCIVSNAELDSIDYGNWQIHLEVAGYCYLAVVVKGEPNQNFLQKIRSTFGEIILNHGDAIAKFQGNSDTVPPEIALQLEQLLEPDIGLQSSHKNSSSSPSTLLWLLAVVLAMILIPWGILNHRSRVARDIEQTAAIQLDAAPELSVYRLDPKVEQGKLIVTGRVPSDYLRGRATNIVREIAQQNNLQLDNQIIRVDVPPDPSLIPSKVQRLTESFNRLPEVAIASSYQSGVLSVSGFILNKSQQENIADSFRQIPGIKQIIFELATQLPTVEESIYFEVGSEKLSFAENSSKIETVRQFLDRYPQLYLKLVAYSNGEGSNIINQKLARERSLKVKSALVDRGVEPSRLVTQDKQYRLATNPDSGLSHYVVFEPFIPTQ